MKIKYKAALNDNTGLGQASRDMLILLKACDFIDLSIEVINISPNPNNFTVDKIKNNRIFNSIKDYDINFIFCPPYQFERFVEKDKINIGYTMWETQNIPHYFVDNINLLDGLLVPVKYNVDFFKNYFKNDLLFEFPLPLVSYECNYSIDKYEDFTFYSIYEWTERKCPLEALQAYFLGFKEYDDTNFILKVRGNPIDVFRKVDILKRIMKLNKYPKIEIIPEEWPEEKVKELHIKSHCYVGVSRGEGWNLSLIDAVLNGNLAISTKTGCVDYLDNAVYIVDGKYEPVLGVIHFEHFNAEQNWINPSINDIKDKMLLTYNKWNTQEKILVTEKEWQQNIFNIKQKIEVDVLKFKLKDIIESIICQIKK